jgi:prepilin-type N-terminal cleavage/methylation domain-containing protein
MIRTVAHRTPQGAPEAPSRTLCSRLARQSGFTLIEMVIVVALLGILSAAFSVALEASVTRSSAVSDQNVLQTEVRAWLNTMVEDFRSATKGDDSNAVPPWTGSPIIVATNSKITFYSPDRLAPDKMRRISYWLDGSTLKRQVAMSTNSDGPPWTGIDDAHDTGTIESVVTNVQAPPIAAQPGAPNSAWASGQIFKYCGQNPSDMEALAESTAPDPITWTCTPVSADQARTIVVRLAVTPSPRSSTYTYGAVATLRWNSQ